MDHVVETAICLSEDQTRRLAQIAERRGVTLEALVAEALDSLFRRQASPDENSDDEEIDDAELLRRMEAELGPLPPVRPAPTIHPEDIVSVIPVPLRAERFADQEIGAETTEHAKRDHRMKRIGQIPSGTSLSNS